MDARGIMQPNDEIQPMSRAEQRHQRKEMKKAMKQEIIGQKKEKEMKKAVDTCTTYKEDFISEWHKRFD